MSLPAEPRNWTREGYLISTDKSLLSLSRINAVFDQDFMYWTSAYPEDVLQRMIESSFCFGLYKNASADPSKSDIHVAAMSNVPGALTKPWKLEQVGFARLVTDNVTFAYLTDLFVLPECQGLGLGGWLIDCLDELIDPLPHLRWFMLRTSMPKSARSYESRLGMQILDTVDMSKGAVMMGKKGKANKA
ncbi:hypothetical protein QQS21_003365 [Conoideocrella luteorostrata]|uniref:N-acetyltransferase domain-containing protein n=1 Tax=Conoideocrella luteorostrata TaxID=1105319 RepID=A0AAJ0CTC0_9HYPO|nr:hypothetical protein QQS21_003365 [Conoideocrella luteorostrata]